jgi:hypothetical protein
VGSDAADAPTSSSPSSDASTPSDEASTGPSSESEQGA